MSFSLGSFPVHAANWAVDVASRSRLLVLCYHGVEDADQFAAQMTALTVRRRPVSLGDVAAAARGGTPLPLRSVLVTFDDGDRTVLESGMPVLRSMGIPAALFVISGLIGGDEPFWWDEVNELVMSGGRSAMNSNDGPSLVRALKEIPDDARRAVINELRRTASMQARRRRQLDRADLLELEGAGVAIGSHTVSHPCLDRCSPAVVELELARSRELLETMLGHPVTAFAYPNGNVSSAIERMVGEAGYTIAFGFDHRMSRNPIPDPLLVSRVRVDSTTGPDRFEMLVSGAHPALHQLRRRP